jgi:hypothetical protein
MRTLEQIGSYINYTIILGTPTLYAFASIVSGALAFLVGIKGLLIICFVVVGLDLLTGIRRSRKEGVQCILSIGLFRTVEKLTAYAILIIAFSLIDVLFQIKLWSILTAGKVATGIILLTEIKSIAENISIILKNNVAMVIFQELNSLWRSKVMKTTDIYDKLKKEDEKMKQVCTPKSEEKKV